ncbi:serine hydroxymethyltransferase [Candidatus Shapirobacteria bacterium]|nr:serine hydroxymethyltransferase [Candidatus Shapirobacteria bacterium]
MEDKEISSLIRAEEERQAETLMLVPSENYTSAQVREALGSVLTNKYAEGYPGKRYYQGNEIIDKIENLAIERAKKLFDVPFVNVQPYSGSPANLAVLGAICQPGAKILSQHLSMGGHLSMGQEASMTSKYYEASYYGLTREGDINWQELEQQAKKCRPKIIFCGGTAFTKVFDFARFGRIADEAGAFFVADIAHIAGLVAGGAHPSPKDDAHVITTTTHKTLRGPRGAMIMVTKKGLEKEPELAKKIDRAVFPGLQGGPHENQVAALAVALKEANTPAFQRYTRQIVKNSHILASELIRYGFTLIGGGSENHLIWIDLTNKGLDGWTAAWALEAAGIICNRQVIPFDSNSPYYPSGLRLGTPAVTTRGMGEREMVKVGQLINEVIECARKMDLQDIGNQDKEKDQKARKRFKQQVFKQPPLLQIKIEVKELCQKFPVP